jgi:hypothetical protein
MDTDQYREGNVELLSREIQLSYIPTYDATESSVRSEATIPFPGLDGTKTTSRLSENLFIFLDHKSLFVVTRQEDDADTRFAKYHIWRTKPGISVDNEDGGYSLAMLEDKHIEFVATISTERTNTMFTLRLENASPMDSRLLMQTIKMRLMFVTASNNDEVLDEVTLKQYDNLKKNDQVHMTMYSQRSFKSNAAILRNPIQIRSTDRDGHADMKIRDSGDSVRTDPPLSASEGIFQ